jgi:hypothetical protein
MSFAEHAVLTALLSRKVELFSSGSHNFELMEAKQNFKACHGIS